MSSGAVKSRSRRSLSVFMAELRESFGMAMGALAAHKLRSALTLLGVLVGVFSIIVVMTAMRAMQSAIESDVGSLGGQTFIVQKWPGVYFGGREGLEKFWRRKDVTYQQGVQVKNKATLAQNVGMELWFTSGEMSSRFAKAPPGTSITGETPGSFPAQNWVVQEGRALLDSDVESLHDVCVLGYTLSTNLFPFGSPISEKVKFNGIDYTVVGVLEEKGSMSGGNQDDFAIIPITTGLVRYLNRRQSVSILVQAKDSSSYDDTVEQVRGILRAVRKVPPGKEDDFEIFSADSVLAQINSFTFAVRIGVSGVSSIALIAAGIGIMNIMLVSVTERTREIGIRRAIGAKKRNIMTQFIMEAIVLCEVGGACGVVLGIIGGNLGAHLMHLSPVIPVDWVLIGLGICSLVGIIFGTYPAYKAANLDPIESLRYE
ncbi:MAG TPA: ABC transporter permease [Verrucomicrobiae bacterium]|jgi:putative ABC transport system permease protein|nr:ABC transporter permease [Verrucomicrobiae bacterium]